MFTTKPFLLLALLYLLWLTIRPRSPPKGHLELAQSSFVEDYSLTVVLPVIQTTLANLDILLTPFLVNTNILYEVAIVCPYPLVSEIRRKLGIVLSNAPRGHPKLTLYPWSGLTHPHQASLDVIAQVKTEWILLLDEYGLENTTECDRAYLIHPRAVQLPVGPHGFTGSSDNWSELSPSDHAQLATFLVPPFVAPSNLLVDLPLGPPSSFVWPALGNHVARSAMDSSGGIVIGSNILDTMKCNSRTRLPDKESTDSTDSYYVGSFPVSPKGFFVLAFPHKDVLKIFIPAACKLFHQGYTVWAYLYDITDQVDTSSMVNEGNCTIPYFQPSKETSSFSDWLDSLGSVPDIVIGLSNQDPVSSTFSFILEQPPFLGATLIRLPWNDLPYTEWIGTLTLHELRYWNVPEITLSVITNDRPHSLRRLLESIRRTLFYGDRVNLRVNMDQTSDPETMQVVQAFEWLHGDVFLHHRVIHGGLLPAVVESWYPDCDDSYGLLLEDDVELSPLAYAWAKMTLLRYKYGNTSPSASKLFGISLYQQKIIELRPAGRQPFDAHAFFQSLSLTPFTPYLSQIPCSWGALYFPSPWRDFHDYLALRLSQRVLSLRHTVVPGVRSNKWSKSWKKYFIELVFLRGYVMLYPNYDAFVSLSTNHLEVGSHVRDEPGELYERKKHLFSLPLMHLSGGLALAGDAAQGRPGLLDLPGGALPDWERLPVLDLMGDVTSIKAIQKRGEDRRAEMGDCEDVASLLPNVRDLFCNSSL